MSELSSLIGQFIEGRDAIVIPNSGSAHLHETDSSSSNEKVILTEMSEGDFIIKLDEAVKRNGKTCSFLTSTHGQGSDKKSFHCTCDYICLKIDESGQQYHASLVELKTSKTRGSLDQLRGGACLLHYLCSIVDVFFDRKLKLKTTSYTIIVLEGKGMSNKRSFKDHTGSGRAASDAKEIQRKGKTNGLEYRRLFPSA